MRLTRVLLALAALLATSCMTLREDEPLGTANNPVRVDGRAGEVSYLGRLRCPSGAAPHFHFSHRGPRGPYGNALDRFALRCVIDNRSFSVWIDHEHPGYAEGRPIAGLESVEATRVPVGLLGTIADRPPGR